MAVDLKVEGIKNIRQVSIDLKAAGDKGMRRELYRAVSAAGKPLVQAARQSASQSLPHSGGLAELVSSSKMRTQMRTGARTAGVRIVATAPNAFSKSKAPKSFSRGIDLSAMDRGILRHPLFGYREFWYTQSVKPRWWSDPMMRGADNARKEILKAVENITEQLAKKGK